MSARMKPAPVESKPLGWVIEYANAPGHTGTNAYLLVKDWARSGQAESVTHTYSFATCTIFHTKEEAERWASLFPNLLGASGYALPKVVPIWRIATLTLENPDAGARLAEIKARAAAGHIRQGAKNLP